MTIIARMKPLKLSLVVIASVFLLSSSDSQSVGKDNHKSLVSSNEIKGNGKFLQRRKPPSKIPDPKLTSEELYSEPLTGNVHDREAKMKRISDEEKGKKGKKDVNLKKYKKNGENYNLTPSDEDKKEKRNKDKNQNLLDGDRYNADWKEETQEEKSSPLK